MGGKSRFDRLLRALADPYRRELLFALLAYDPQDGDSGSLDIQLEDEDVFSELNIVMGHLPGLDEMGIIDWDQDEDRVAKGPDWEEFEPFLRLIAENKDELPEEWFGDGDDEYLVLESGVSC